MVHSLIRLKKQFALTVTTSFILTPIVAYSVASIFQMPTNLGFFLTPFGLVLGAICLLLSTWVFFFSYNFLNPVFQWLDQQPGSSTTPLPEKLSSHLHSFSTTYWSFFLRIFYLYPLFIFGLQKHQAQQPPMVLYYNLCF